MSDIINSLKRLERAGSESSRCTKKLHEAAATVACQVIKSVCSAGFSGVELPRSYRVRNVKSNVGSNDFLVWESDDHDEFGYAECLWIDGQGGYLHGDFRCPIPNQTREGSLQFAKDVSEGLLEEIADFLEERAKVAEQAADKLNQASVMA